jgi:hypothetical protein
LEWGKIDNGFMNFKCVQFTKKSQAFSHFSCLTKHLQRCIFPLAGPRKQALAGLEAITFGFVSIVASGALTQTKW